MSAMSQKSVVHRKPKNIWIIYIFLFFGCVWNTPLLFRLYPQVHAKWRYLLVSEQVVRDAHETWPWSKRSQANNTGTVAGIYRNQRHGACGSNFHEGCKKIVSHIITQKWSYKGCQRTTRYGALFFVLNHLYRPLHIRVINPTPDHQLEYVFIVIISWLTDPYTPSCNPTNNDTINRSQRGEFSNDGLVCYNFPTG